MSNEPLSAALADALDGVLPRMAFLQYGQFFGDDPDFDIEAYYLRVAESLIKEHPDLFAARASRPEPKDATPEPCGFCGRSREACESWRSGVWPCCGLCDHAKRADGAQEWTITEPAASRPEPKDDDLAGQLASRMRRIESIALGGITGDDGASRCDAILSIVLDEVQPLLAARVPVSPPDPEGLRAALHGAQIAMLNDPETRCITDDDGHMERFIPAHVAIRETNRARAAIQASPAYVLRRLAALASNQDTEETTR